MSHQSGELSDVFSPRSQFYQGPYGRMFRNLPAHVPTLDLLQEKSIKGLPNNIADCLKEFLAESNQVEKEKKLTTLKDKLNNQLAYGGKVKQTERAILTEIKKALQDTEAGREAILKLLARTMIETRYQSIDQTRDNPDIPAGYTYFLQFITHDITFDPTSSLMRFNDPDKLRNFRTPRLDLDSLYGAGPDDSPFMYNYDPYDPNYNDPNQRYYLLVGKGKNNEEEEDDLPRNSRGRALIGDPRNDENTMISQLQLAFIKFHNVIMDELLCDKGLKGQIAFREAQRLVRWHYQWVVLHDVLPKFVDDEILDEILGSPDYLGKPKLCYYQWRHRPFIPVEFAMAAFRFGHSMIRNRYRFTKRAPKRFTLDISVALAPEVDLRGFSHLPPKWTVQWEHFFEINNDPNDLQQSRRIDTQLSNILNELPQNLGGDGNRSLATSDLLRGYRMDLPSGQAVAQAMGEIPLEGSEEPLLHYILREAKDLRDGRKLGPVGGRIVAEVIIGLLVGDPHSFLNVDPWWYPGFPRPRENPLRYRDQANPLRVKDQNNPFRVQDILHHAKVTKVYI